MTTILIDNDTYTLPSNWDELSLEQLEFLAQSLTEDVPVQQVLVYMTLKCLGAHIAARQNHFGIKLQHLLGLDKPTTRMIIGKKRYDLTAEQFQIISQTMDFLVAPVEDEDNEAPTNRYAISPDLSIDHYSTFHISGKEYKGSGDGLMGLIFEQYMYLQTYLSGLPSGNSRLEHVLACVWCPDGKFFADHIQDNAHELEQLPATQKMIMFWLIQSSLHSFGQMFPRLFNGDGSPQGNVFDSQLRLLDSLAQHDMTKKDAVRKGWLLDAFYTLDELVLERERMEKDLENHR